MSKPNLLVVSPPDHYSLRNLSQINDLAAISISNDEADIKKLGKDADTLLYTSLTGKTVAFSKVWPHTPKVRWVHSLSAGVEKVLIPDFIDSAVPLTNARGVFKRSLAEFAVLGMLYFTKRVRRRSKASGRTNGTISRPSFLKTRSWASWVMAKSAASARCSLSRLA